MQINNQNARIFFLQNVDNFYCALNKTKWTEPQGNESENDC